MQQSPTLGYYAKSLKSYSVGTYTGTKISRGTFDDNYSVLNIFEGSENLSVEQVDDMLLTLTKLHYPCLNFALTKS